jgi:heterodisulfide reductase subunit B
MMAKANMMDYSYYPGCSLHATAKEYDASVRAVFSVLDMNLHELEDWNCCSASSGHSLNRALSLALPGRNLAIAQRTGQDLVMPCAACFNRHKVADYELKNNEENRIMIEDAVGFQYTGNTRVRTPLDVISNEIGLEQLESHVTRPLSNLKVVSYYGCLLVRPKEIMEFENPEHPTLMNQLLSKLGADVCTWSNATDCCGGGLALTKTDVATRMVNRLVDRAREAGADAMVTSCPLCQMNLEMHQTGADAKMPIFYFTELIGLAFGLEAAQSWLKLHLIDPNKLLGLKAK